MSSTTMCRVANAEKRGKVSQNDPTRTITIRRMFEQNLVARFNKLKAAIIQLIVVEDAFGLKQRRNIVNPRGLFNQRFSFASDAQKIAAFENWLRTQIEATVTGDQLWERYIKEGYEKGRGRAWDELNKAKRATSRTPEGDAFIDGGKSQFMSLGGPVSQEKVKILASRTYTDLVGVTDQMAVHIRRELVDGLIQGRSITQMAKGINAKVDTIGITRGKIIARTEIIRAHAEGSLDAYEQLGTEEVGLMAELSTAGDGRVCEKCLAASAAGPYKVEKARGMIPIHPQCRCAWVPKVDLKKLGIKKRTPKRVGPAPKPPVPPKPEPKPVAPPKPKRVPKPKITPPVPELSPAQIEAAKQAERFKSKPLHIKFTGRATEFSEKVWKEIGDQLKDSDHAQRVGQLVKAEVKERLKPKLEKLEAERTRINKELSTVRKKQLEKARELGFDHPEVKELFEEGRRLDRLAEDIYKKQIPKLYSDTSLDVMKEVRDFGYDADEFVINTHAEFHGGANEVAMTEHIQYALDRMPTDWTDDIVKNFDERDEVIFEIEKRGYYKDEGRVRVTVRISGKDKDDLNSTMLHELVHAAEIAASPFQNRTLKHNLAYYQKQFLIERAGASTADQAKKKITTIYKGTTERGIKDELFSHYAGKIYGNLDYGQNYEVMTMGVEHLHSYAAPGSYQQQLWTSTKEGISTHLDLVLGLLTGH